MSCIQDDFTTSPSDVLTFSCDVVKFDTVVTDLGTPTARLVVHNRAKKSINISSIGFRNQQSVFSMNVDGVSGNRFSNVEIRARDSIYVFIECFPPISQQNKPTLIEDQLVFVTNGVEQTVGLEAWGQNVERLQNVTLESDMRLTADVPYVVFDSLVVNPGVKLTIDPGARLLFHDKAKIVVHGTLEAVGAPGRMIHMRSDRLDNVLPDVPYDLLAGQWEGIRIARESFDNRMEFVDMRSTVSGLRVDSCDDTSRQKLTLLNSWLHNSQGNALSAKYSKVDAYGCCFSEAAEAVVSLTGGDYCFEQCTVANNYLFSAVTQPLVCLYNLFADRADDPARLMRASFDNCIIYGLAADLNEGDLNGTDVYLRNVLLKSAGTDDEHFISCVWEADPLFYTVREDYYFNYRLRDESPAIGAGNAAYVSPICVFDVDGLDRLASGAPDLGAYVFQPAPPPNDEE